MSGFSKRPGGGALLVLGLHEAGLIRTLASQLVELLRHGEPDAVVAADPLASLVDLTGPVEAPTDPVLARLLPDAYRDDDEAAADFRRYTERALRGGKVDDACAVIESLEAAGLPAEELVDPRPDDLEVALGAAAAESWLRCLTDLRLALATRLGIDEDDEEVWAAMPADHPRVHVHDIYDWLGYLQETLVRALSARRR